MEFACGQCIGCRVARSQSWAIRCMHESQMHKESSFVTLTYENAPLSLDYRDFQMFLKRLRKARGPVRYFAAGEYGDKLSRPHFHALLFGVGWPDKKKHSKTLFKSEELQKLWKHGFGSIGDVTFQSAGYVARYALKKITGERAKEHYMQVDVDTGELAKISAEMAHMSLKPGIGYSWFEKFWKDTCLARDGVVVNGKEFKLPRYYDALLEKISIDMSTGKEFDRWIKSQKYSADNTPERLAVREIVEKARLAQMKRSL
ncbi:MAG: replication initiator protein [Microvirus sp.]|nr:MAG: replication initiator protein [Microvirus sp.]